MYVTPEWVVRGTGGGLSNHYMVISKNRVRERWQCMGKREVKGEVVRVERLQEREVGSKYRDSVKVKLGRYDVDELTEVEDIWKALREA